MSTPARRRELYASRSIEQIEKDRARTKEFHDRQFREKPEHVRELHRQAWLRRNGGVENFGNCLACKRFIRIDHRCQIKQHEMSCGECRTHITTFFPINLAPSRIIYCMECRSRRRQSPMADPLPIHWPFQGGEVESDQLMVIINNLVPREISEVDRQDVCQELCMLALEQGIYSEDYLREQVQTVYRQIKRSNYTYGISIYAKDRESDGMLLDRLEGPEIT